MIAETPSVFEHWDTPREITEYVCCDFSEITHLSPYLIFSGKDSDGKVADFESCPNLKIATGNFKGRVDFRNSAIEKIENLNVGKNKRGDSASFYMCPLKIATGNFEGCVSFKCSGVEKIENLHAGENKYGRAAWFDLCEFLKTATGNFPGAVNFMGSNIEKIENLHITGKDYNGFSANFSQCKHLQIATGNFEGSINFWNSGIERIENLNIQNPDKNDKYTDFSECPNLQTLEGWDLSKKIKIEPEKLEAEIKRRSALKTFIKETQPEELPFL
jgi:hypothetical protein